MRNNYKKHGAAFMRLLVESGFGLAQASDGSSDFVIESKTSYQAKGHVATAAGQRTDINALPGHRVEMPRTIAIRFRPAQSVITTPRFEPATKQRVKPKNTLEVFDTLGEHRDYLQERYLEAIERVRDQRQEKIDARLEKNKELLDRRREVADSWLPLQDPENIGLQHTDLIDDDHEGEDDDVNS